ncbi:LysR family transcriptional regulator [Oxalobacteraceae bacterium CAVE-383]|nr:LysR family transcriptional regulator [Oxalobacteraceae bacterium CAVE-383]
MELRALRYFVELVRQKSFTAAAERMHVTQPTISKMIKALELEIGAPLLLRESRQLTLTDVGEIVYRRGLDVLAAHAELQDELNELGTMMRGSLTVGLPPMGGPLFTPIVAAFRQRYPNIELKLFEQGSKAIEALLLNGELELGVVLQPVDPDIFELLPITSQPLWLIAQRGSRWEPGNSEGQPAPVALADLRGESFVFYGESYALNDVILNACRAGGFTPTIVGRSGQWDFMASLVQAGMGIALLPMPYCRRLDPAAFICRPLVEPEIHWNIAIGWRRNAYLSRAARAWLEVARETHANDVQPLA